MADEIAQNLAAVRVLRTQTSAPIGQEQIARLQCSDFENRMEFNLNLSYGQKCKYKSNQSLFDNRLLPHGDKPARL